MLFAAHVRVAELHPDAGRADRRVPGRAGVFSGVLTVVILDNAAAIVADADAWNPGSRWAGPAMPSIAGSPPMPPGFGHEAAPPLHQSRTAPSTMESVPKPARHRTASEAPAPLSVATVHTGEGAGAAGRRGSSHAP